MNRTLPAFSSFLCIVGLAFALLAGPGVNADASHYPPPLDAGTMDLSLKWANLMRQERDGGFFLVVFDGKRAVETPLERIEREGETIRVSSGMEAENRRFEFRVKESQRYLSLTLVKVEGVGTGRDCGLIFRRSKRAIGSPVTVVPLDYMIQDESKQGDLSVAWPWLWNRGTDDPLGGFAVFKTGDDASCDRSLAQIWAQETLPHPAIERPWTEEEVWKWLQEYYDTFSGLTETTLSATSLEELSFLTDKMKALGMRRIYLHTNTWRGEYWPGKRSFVDVNPEVFPGGRADLVKFSRHLRQKGMLLRLHNVSAGVGRADPERVLAPHVDSRLASWVKGRLEKKLDASSREIFFRPDPDVSFPHLRMASHWNFRTFRIGNEIVRATQIRDTDKAVWRLTGVERNLNSRPALPDSVEEGEEVVGLYSAYGQNFVPSPKSDLLITMGEEYARLINEAGLSHQHYDGAEINNAEEQPWGFDKFSAVVASRVDHPTTTSTSGGRSTRWNLERRFSKIRDLKELGYWAATIPMQLDGHRSASSLLDAHFEIASRLLLDARRLGFGKPEPMFGISREMEEGHGLAVAYGKLFEEWKEIIFDLDPSVATWLRRFLQPIKSPLRQRGNHFKGWDVPVMEKRDDGYYFIPTRVLTRDGRDSPWISGQEFGPWGPRQYVRPGEAITLVNPHGKQPPGLIVRVLPDLVEASPDGEGRVATNQETDLGKTQLDDYRTGADLVETGGASKAMGSDAFSANLWPHSLKSTAVGATHLRMEGATMILTAENPNTSPYWTEGELPSWRCQLPMKGRRGLAIDVVGDGSGARLVVELEARGRRDYVVDLDFTGARRIVIPTGEVSWASAGWGWRFGAKQIDYDGTLTGVKIGFGYLPPQSKVRAEVRGVALLENVDAVLRNPMIRLGNGNLRLKGEVRSGEYLTWEPEEGARVFDKNWNFLRKLEGETESWEIPHGDVVLVLDNPEGGPQPWIETQVITRGEPHRFRAQR